MTKIESLLFWYNAGYRTLVPWANRKNPNRHPLITRQDTVPSWATVAGWHARWPLADWAYRPTGGVVVLDLEMKNGLDGRKALADLGGDWTSSMMVRSYSGGFHYYFRSNTPLVGGWSLRPGIEIKAENGTVHIPPSEGYSLLSEMVAVSDLPVLPAGLESMLHQERRHAKSRTNYEAPTYANGERRHRLCSMAGALRNIGLTEPELIASLLAVRSTRCEGDFPDSEVVAIAKDYATKEVGTVGLALLGDRVAASAVAFCERHSK